MQQEPGGNLLRARAGSPDENKTFNKGRNQWKGCGEKKKPLFLSLVVTVYKIPSVIEHPTGMLLRCGMCVEADISSLPPTGRGSVLRGIGGSDGLQVSFRSQGDKMAPELSDKRATVSARIVSQRGPKSR